MTDGTPLVTVVIPTYNRALFVTKAIDSVLGQTFTDYEIIVVDDGSTDPTKEILNGYVEKIRYIYQDNSGVSAARNTGIRIARGEWVAFLDSDDEWRTDYLSKQIKRVRDFPSIVMQTTNCLFIGLDGMTRSYFEINGSLAEFSGMDYLFIKEPFRFIVKHGPWQVGSTIIRRKAITEVGLFDTSFNINEDFDIMARVALEGSFGLIKEELVNVYRRNEPTECLTNQVKKNPIQAMESAAEIYKKLIRIETLNNEDRKALNQLFGANRRSIGNLLLEYGNVKDARAYYQRALFIDPSIASLGKYILSYLPTKTNVWLTEKIINLRTKKKTEVRKLD